MEMRYDGERLFGSVQATWNLLEPSAGRALQAAHQAGLIVIIKEALANGRLTARNTQDKFTAQLTRIAGQKETGIDALALAAALAQPWASIVLSGAANEKQLRSNLSATKLSLDAETLEELLSLAEPPEQYWATRSQLAWN
jgi:aryl-alcohol dehydrogenase-like predicted oxidoreductase